MVVCCSNLVFCTQKLLFVKSKKENVTSLKKEETNVNGSEKQARHHCGTGVLIRAMEESKADISPFDFSMSMHVSYVRVCACMHGKLIFEEGKKLERFSSLIY